MGDISTERGLYVRDEFDLWHYKHERLGHISAAIADALKHRPEGAAAWFWFNGSPAPLREVDSIQDVHDRWVAWRNAYQGRDGGYALLRELAAMVPAERQTEVSQTVAHPASGEAPEPENK